MAMVVKNNMSAVRTLNTLNKNSSALQKSLAKVSSGMKINSAQDDASGYAISERMRVQIRSLDQANQNTQNASSLMKTAEGAVSSTMEILKTLKEKAINAATDTNTDSDRATIQKELDQFIDQIDDNALTTFNGKYLVDGSKSQQGDAVGTAMTNQSLSSDTAGTTAITNLKNRNNESLEISSHDFVTASYVMNGNTYTTKFRVGTNTVNSIFTNLNAVKGPETSASKGPDTSTSVAGAGGAGATTPTPNAQYTAIQTAAGNLVTALDNYIKDTTNGLGKTGLSDAATLTTTVANTGASNAETLTSSSPAATEVAAADIVSAVATDIGNTTNQGATKSAMTADPLDGGVGTALYNAYQDYVAAVTAYNTAVTNAGPGTSGTGSTGTASSGEGVEGNGFNSTGVTSSGTYIGLSTAGNAVNTADDTNGITVTAANKGLGGQISGLSISITDSEGNVKKSANAALDAFKTTIYAKNESANNEMTFHTGASANQAITVGLEDMRSEALGLKGRDGITKVSVATQDKANAAVSVFDNAIQKVLDQQATIGAVEARLEYTSQNLTTSSENVQAAESTIRDADMAKEMTTYTKNNVLLQAAQSMLAQANQNSSAVLSLLQ